MIVKGQEGQILCQHSI